MRMHEFLNYYGSDFIDQVAVFNNDLLDFVNEPTLVGLVFLLFVLLGLFVGFLLLFVGLLMPFVFFMVVVVMPVAVSMPMPIVTITMAVVTSGYAYRWLPVG